LRRRPLSCAKPLHPRAGTLSRVAVCRRSLLQIPWSIRGQPRSLAHTRCWRIVGRSRLGRGCPRPP
jgi:hypothetical protein